MSRTDTELLALVYRRSAAIRAKRYGAAVAAVALAIVTVSSSNAWEDPGSDLDTFDDRRDTSTTAADTATVPNPGQRAGATTAAGNDQGAKTDGGRPGDAAPGGTTGDAPGEVDGGPAPSTTKGGVPVSATRTAPYDYGCAAKAPCSVEDTDARNGRLRVAPAAKPCVGYSLPPLPCANGDDVSTYAGVGIDAQGSRSEVVASAVVRRTSASATGLSACLALVDQADGNGYGGWCQPLPEDGTITIVERFDISRTTASVLGLYVYLQGDGTATVERISFTLT